MGVWACGCGWWVWVWACMFFFLCDIATFYVPGDVKGKSTLVTPKRPEEMEFVVDSGASMHIMSKKESSSEELWTVLCFLLFLPLSSLSSFFFFLLMVPLEPKCLKYKGRVVL